ncbi:G patch domain-containing protein 1 homolog [Athalia rosae]|uniref:G patch domain-containing protein 1 homolog n=1 Tax=Athalia rosae TaxID=37344 RepID=UPI002033A974|nr:G patch domain-containing protein 1 homolog [Athalia rosae]
MMAESDDEHYVKFGTALDPLDEDNLPRKKPVTIEDQYACDEQGRRRFHGAFTGGFSAGYFNSVGTRDGWRPQQFKSSRSSKAESRAQRPQDFMDDEDMGEFGIAPTAIRATADYTDHEKKGAKRERAKYVGDGPIPGTPVLRELLKPVRDTVGIKLLKQMGWKPGQGVGPRLSKKEKSKVKQQNDKMKVYGCPLPPQHEEAMETDSAESDNEDSEITFAPDDYEPFRCNPKDNFFGIGYSGLDKRPILSHHVTLFEPAAFKLQEKNKKLSIRGQAFGVGAFEAEDEDIYSRDDMSQYDFSLEPKAVHKSRWSNEKPGTSQNKCIEGFVAAKKQVESRNIFKPPELPKGFEPVHIIRKSRFEPTAESTSLEIAKRKGLARHDLRAEDRARIINDPNPIAMILSNHSKTESTNIKKPVGDSRLKSILPAPDVSNSESDAIIQSPSKKPSIISNIITKTLNLHGRERTAKNQETSLIDSSHTDVLKAPKHSWLEKLSAKSFVKGGVENLSLTEKADNNSTEDVSIKTSNPDSSKILTTKVPHAELEVPHDDSGDATFRPFIANPDKQKRYEQFLAFSKSGDKSKLKSIQPLSMTEWEQDHERVEFEQAARLYKPLTGSMGDRFVSGKNQDDLHPLSVVEKTPDADFQLRDAATKKMFGKLTRQKFEWQPASILCKRFNIAEPRTGCAQPETDKKTKFSVFDYLEESVHNSSTFQSATDVAVRIKSENLNGTAVQEGLLKGSSHPHKSLSNQLTGTSAMLLCDNADKDKVSAKERNFEVKYERIFGKNVNVLEIPVTAEVNSNTIPSKSGSEAIDNVLHVKGTVDNNKKFIESSINSEHGESLPGPYSTSTDQVDSNKTVANKIDEKKDLFKAIFLSSSEDSDSEREDEVDDEKLKSVLIGQNPGALNTQRNTSPPRGIFANLDLDSLNQVAMTNNKINFIETKNSNPNGDTSKTAAPSQSKDGSDNTSDSQSQSSVKAQRLFGLEADPDLEILPNMYGPVLPTKTQKTIENVPSDTGQQAQTQKPVFKSIVVPVTHPIPPMQGEWVEKKKEKKTKKEKKKHKHKDHKKHKHKKHRR